MDDKQNKSSRSKSAASSKRKAGASVSISKSFKRCINSLRRKLSSINFSSGKSTSGKSTTNKQRTNKSTTGKSKQGKTYSGILGNHKIRALIAGLIAVVVILFVVLGAVGAFDNAEQKAQKAAKKEAATQVMTEQDTNEASVIENTAEAEKETEDETVDPDARCVYLTFEAGPSSVTSDILDVLAMNDVKATFFVRADETQADVMKRIVDKGHTIGVYSMTGDWAQIYSDIEQFKNDVNGCRQFIYQKTGVLADVYRFPGGSLNASYMIPIDECKAYLDELGMRYYDWNINTGDDHFDTADAAYIKEIVLGELNTYEFKTNVVCFHDMEGKTTTAEALDEILPELRKAGFQFSRILPSTPEMTFDIY